MGFRSVGKCARVCGRGWAGRFAAAGEPDLPHLNPKKKIWEKLQPDLRVDADGRCVWKAVPFTTSAGAVMASPETKNGGIS